MESVRLTWVTCETGNGRSEEEDGGEGGEGCGEFHIDWYVVVKW
jgi:hypothetical protein